MFYEVFQDSKKQKIYIFESGSSSVTAPSWATKCLVRGWGSGANGSSSDAGEGGGGGAYVEKYFSVTGGTDTVGYSFTPTTITLPSTLTLIAGDASGITGGSVSGSGTPDYSHAGNNGSTGGSKTGGSGGSAGGPGQKPGPQQAENGLGGGGGSKGDPGNNGSKPGGGGGGSGKNGGSGGTGQPGRIVIVFYE